MKICGSDASDLIPRDDPASRHYRPREACGRCHGDCVVPCGDCDGKSDADGMIDIDGEKVHCEQRRCSDGLVPCPRCEGSGKEI